MSQSLKVITYFTAPLREIYQEGTLEREIAHQRNAIGNTAEDLLDTPISIIFYAGTKGIPAKYLYSKDFLMNKNINETLLTEYEYQRDNMVTLLKLNENKYIDVEFAKKVKDRLMPVTAEQYDILNDSILYSFKLAIADMKKSNQYPEIPAGMLANAVYIKRVKAGLIDFRSITYEFLDNALAAKKAQTPTSVSITSQPVTIQTNEQKNVPKLVNIDNTEKTLNEKKYSRLEQIKSEIQKLMEEKTKLEKELGITSSLSTENTSNEKKLTIEDIEAEQYKVGETDQIESLQEEESTEKRALEEIVRNFTKDADFPENEQIITVTVVEKEKVKNKLRTKKYTSMDFTGLITTKNIKVHDQIRVAGNKNIALEFSAGLIFGYIPTQEDLDSTPKQKKVLPPVKSTLCVPFASIKNIKESDTHMNTLEINLIDKFIDGKQLQRIYEEGISYICDGIYNEYSEPIKCQSSNITTNIPIKVEGDFAINEGLMKNDVMNINKKRIEEMYDDSVAYSMNCSEITTYNKIEIEFSSDLNYQKYKSLIGFLKHSWNSTYLLAFSQAKINIAYDSVIYDDIYFVALDQQKMENEEEIGSVGSDIEFDAYTLLPDGRSRVDYEEEELAKILRDEYQIKSVLVPIIDRVYINADAVIVEKFGIKYSSSYED